MAAAIGAMREMAFATPLHLVRPQLERFTRYFVQAVDNSGFTMAEDNRTGELSYGQQSPDEDGDGIPFLKYGHGRHGVAPVSAARVAVNIGGPENEAFHKMKGDPYVPGRFDKVTYAYVPTAEAPQALAPRLSGSDLLASTDLNVALGDREGVVEREPMVRFNGTLIPLPASRPIARESDLPGKEIYRLNCTVCHGDLPHLQRRPDAECGGEHRRYHEGQEDPAGADCAG